VDVALTRLAEGSDAAAGHAILAVSDRASPPAKRPSARARSADWQPVLERNRHGQFPYTPPTALLFGLHEALAILREERLPNVFARHARLAERAAAPSAAGSSTSSVAIPPSTRTR